MRQAREGWDALLVVTVLFLRKRATTGKRAKLISADEMVLHNRNSMSKRERKLPVACNGVGDVHYLAISSRCAIVDVGEKSECVTILKGAWAWGTGSVVKQACCSPSAWNKQV